MYSVERNARAEGRNASGRPKVRNWRNAAGGGSLRAEQGIRIVVVEAELSCLLLDERVVRRDRGAKRELVLSVEDEDVADGSGETRRVLRTHDCSRVPSAGRRVERSHLRKNRERYERVGAGAVWMNEDVLAGRIPSGLAEAGKEC